MGYKHKSHKLLAGLALVGATLGAARVLLSTKQGMKLQKELFIKSKVAGKKLVQDLSCELENIQKRSQELIAEGKKVAKHLQKEANQDKLVKKIIAQTKKTKTVKSTKILVKKNKK